MREESRAENRTSNETSIQEFTVDAALRAFVEKILSVSVVVILALVLMPCHYAIDGPYSANDRVDFRLVPAACYPLTHYNK